MSISTRIEAIEQHLTDDYSVLEVAGANLTNVDKNIINLKPTWQERLLYFINNGTDVVWNNWEKVEGTGETLTLNSTEEAPMKINLKGNTSQEGTPTPETPQDIHVVSGDNYINVCGKNLLDLPNNSITSNGVTSTITNGKLKIVGTTTTNWFSICNLNIPLESGTYIFSYTNKKVNRYNFSIKYEDNTTQVIYGNAYSNTPITLNKNATITSMFSDNNTTGATFDYEDYLMLEKGSTATEYEEYKGASYEINLGKNLLDLQLSIMKSLNTSGTWSENVYTHNGLTLTINDDKTIKINGTATDQETFLLENQQIKYPTGTYYLSGSINGSNNSYDIRMFNYDGTSAVAQCYTGAKEINVINNKQVYNMAIVVRSGQTLNNVVFYPMFSTSNDTNYSPYFTPIELCKIGDYQDRIAKSTGKNLFNKKITPENYFYNASGEKTYDGNNLYINQTIENINYNSITISFFSKIGYASARVCEYNSSGTFTSRTLVETNNQVVNLNNTTTKIILSVNSDNNAYFNCLMINEGNTALPYEPYGKVWYLNKQIGKVVLDGSESWTIVNSTATNRVHSTPSVVVNPNGELFSNYFTYNTNTWRLSDGNTGIYRIASSGNIIISDTIISDEAFKTWLSTHNTIVYYVLANPTYTEITDTTLLSQLETVKRSYDGQTNINQDNNDLPFILDVTALKQLTQ